MYKTTNKQTTTNENMGNKRREQQLQYTTQSDNVKQACLTTLKQQTGTTTMNTNQETATTNTHTHKVSTNTKANKTDNDNNPADSNNTYMSTKTATRDITRSYTVTKNTTDDRQHQGARAVVLMHDFP